MKKHNLLLIFLCLSFGITRGQVILIGHNMLNNKPIANTSIFVKENGVITKTVNTQSKSEFLMQLDFGKVYHIYFQNPTCPLMHMEVNTSNVPMDKYEYRMGYELNVPFAHKDDEDIDTAVFAQPFHKAVFNGKKQIIPDTTYNNQFARNVLKKPEKKVVREVEVKKDPEITEVKEPPTPTLSPNMPSLVTGKVLLEAGNKLPISNKPISIIGKKGNVLKSTATNRFGAFSFADIVPSEVSRIKMDINATETANNALNLHNSKNQSVKISKPVMANCEWVLQTDEVVRLVDNNYTSNIGGKLVSSSAKSKKFFASKTVYLSNKMNTVIKKTTTNKLGTFVFEDIKPDHSYFIGVDKADVAAGEKIDLLSKDDNYIATLDTLTGGKNSLRVNSTYNKTFNEVSIGDDEIKMDIVATIFGDNTNTPIGKLKIVLLNDNYEVIDSAITNDFGTFKFKYLPFLKRFYLSAENNDNVLDVFKNILIYSSDEHLIKIMTHQKGKKFNYNPVSAEISRLRDVELEDPWLEFLDPAPPAYGEPAKAPRAIVENILFETGKFNVTPQAGEILDKIILVLNTNQKLRIEIGAHTDSKGNAAANLKLSELRAQSVQDYISKAGINKQRILCKGYGETKLLNNCGDNQPCSDVEHAQNRRIEFKILE